jgi:hypothetical protein
MATAYHRKVQLNLRLCLSCCKPHDAGYCQACFERQGRAYRDVVADAGWDAPVRRYCRACGQWRELTAGRCACGTEKR